MMLTGLVYAQVDIYNVISESEAKRQQQQDRIELNNMIERASNGHADAQFKLGYMYRTGQRPDGQKIQVAQEAGILNYYSNSFKTDYDKAFYWLSKSAKNGNAEAENDLGIMYDYGQGIFENADSAYFWYYKAAEKCLVQAQNNLARLYFLGKGVEVNFQKSYAWASIAYDNGSAMAERGMNILKEKLNESDISEANKIKKEINEKLKCKI